MRMWLVNPRLMCRRHLLGEHVELHMMVGCIVRGKSLAGYIETGLIDTRLIRRRHLELVREMERRGYTHASELPAFKALGKGGGIDAAGNLLELRRRCKSCAALMKDHYQHARGRKIQKRAQEQCALRLSQTGSR